MNRIDEVLARETAPHGLALQIHGLSMRLRSNDVAVVDAMRRVYGRYVQTSGAPPRYEIWALDLNSSRYMPADRSAFERYVVASGKTKDPFLDDGAVRYVVK